MKTMILFAVLCGTSMAEESQKSVTTYVNELPSRPTFQSMTAQEAADLAGLIFITKQEADDVVKAMEILMPGVPVVYEKSEGNSGFGASMECPSYQKGINASREEIERGLKDLAWARSILVAWKLKLEKAK